MKRYAILIGLLIAFGIAWRLVPHASNFAPVAAIAIVAGMYAPRRVAMFAPLAVMVTSDLIIGMHQLAPLVWATYVLIAFMSHKLLSGRSAVSGVVFAPLASGIFFIVTNFGVWLQGQMYANTWEGLMRCYYMALPFLRGTLLSDIVFTASILIIITLARSIKFPEVIRHRVGLWQH